jgi:hypothetical protein
MYYFGLNFYLLLSQHPSDERIIKNKLVGKSKEMNDKFALSFIDAWIL